MFEKFPKVRPPLSKAIADFYIQQYQSNREGHTAAASLAQKMEAWLHKQVASDLGQSEDAAKVTLELGAGTLNQLRYEPNVRTYDIVEPFKELYESSAILNRVRHCYSDIAEISAQQQYDRITSIAVLEHVCDLPDLIARSGNLLKPKGTFRASIPNEGTWLWTLGWKLTTGLEFKLKHGLDYGELMRHEHVNTAHEIEEVLQYFYAQVQCKVFGVSKSTAFYRYYECSEPILERCAAFTSKPV